MKKYFFILLTALTLYVTSCGNAQSSKTNLNAVEFSDKIKEMPNAPLIDVRTPEEFSKGHLQNALNINWNGGDFQSQISKLDKTKPVFVYCLSGGRSGSAASQMRSDGFQQVFELNGGIMKWRAANLPETVNTITTSTGLTLQQFQAQIKSDKIYLVDFYADWCAPCKKMQPYLNEISKEMANKVVVLRINADDNKQLCKDLAIDALPVLHVYKNTAKTWSNVGFIEKAEVVKQLN